MPFIFPLYNIEETIIFFGFFDYFLIFYNFAIILSKMKRMKYECKHCKSKKFIKDEVHAEVYCAACGLVHEHPPIYDNGKPAKQYCYR